MTIPDDLAEAVARNAKAQAALATLDRTNRFALAFRVGATKTPAARAAKIAAYVEMLARGETLHPVAKKAAAKKATPKKVAQAPRRASR